MTDIINKNKIYYEIKQRGCFGTTKVFDSEDIIRVILKYATLISNSKICGIGEETSIHVFNNGIELGVFNEITIDYDTILNKLENIININ